MKTIKTSRIVEKILKKYGEKTIVTGLLESLDWGELLLQLSNRCIFRASAERNKKKQREWYRQARIFHRALDEIKLEKKGKIKFKVVRKDIYECQKCKKRFKVDPAKEENAKFDLDKGMVVVTCPGCGIVEE
jgi:DNA-directed RNA polymerase subunit RPC12/RpoP